MAKFYQHMQPGPTLGKVTKLKYIDDISDDELIIYVFEDGSKSDEAYVAEMNCMEAFNGRYMMTELTDPTNKWTFETKEFNLEETKTVTDSMGNVFELPDPGIGINGEHVSLSFSEDGTPMTRTSATSGKRTDAKPPRVYKNKKVEPKEDYLLSLHPELLDDSYVPQQVNESIDIMSHSVPQQQSSQQPKEQIVIGKRTQPVLNQQRPAAVSQPQQVKTVSSPISTNVIETVKHASIIINLDDILNSKEYDNVSIIYQGSQTDLNIQEFVWRLTDEEKEQAEPVVEEPKITSYNDPAYKEDILITNMIDKSKKKVYTIGVDIDLELPPKEVYDTIKNVYPDGMAQHFVISLARRMDSSVLKEALTSGLTAYYENSSNNGEEEKAE